MPQYRVHVTAQTYEGRLYNSFCKESKADISILDSSRLMVSATLTTTQKGVREYLLGLVTTLDARGFNVLGEKIEVSSQGKDAIQHFWRKQDSEKYFEGFIPITKSEDNESQIREFAKAHRLQIHRSYLVKPEGGKCVDALSKRWYKVRAEKAESEFYSLKEEVAKAGFTLQGIPGISFVIHDKSIGE